MDLLCWQERMVEDSAGVESPKIAFSKTKKFFAVDASGSTSGAIMYRQKDSVLSFHANPDDFICKWHHHCYEMRVIDAVADDYFDGLGGTRPACILERPEAVDQIKASDIWVLLTDGEIREVEVAELSRLAENVAVTQVPVILLITGGRSREYARTNLSVGISFFAGAREALILFKDMDGSLYVIDAKGPFEPLKKDSAGDPTDWDSLTKFADEDSLKEQCNALNISFSQDHKLRSNKGVSLGAEWATTTSNALVNVTDLLDQNQIKSQDLRNLLAEEAISQLSLTCKTRGQLNDLRSLLIRHKQRELVVRLEDRHGANEAMKKVQVAKDPQEKSRFVEELRQAHAANRVSYQQMKDAPSEESRRVTELNRLIDRGLRIISGFEKSSYTADILSRKSNRAMRSGVVSGADTEVHLSALDLSENIRAFRGICSICCGEEQTMSVVLKKLDTVEENTTDFALNFPLAAAQAKQNANIISSQCICFQCAILLEQSIYHENVVATIPTLDYQGPNKRYINHQLYLALTAGLTTGVSGVLQLYMTILERTLEAKSWCSPASVDDPEVLARRRVLEWSLRNLLENCPCRENFAETGEWVMYPQALSWAANDYGEAGLDSWIIQYPIAGFSQLMRWYEILNLHVPEGLLPAILKAKLVHLVTSKVMDGLLREKNGDKSWTLAYLQLIYKAFNAPGVPRDLLSPNSLVSVESFWTSLQHVLGPYADVVRFLGLFNKQLRSQDLVCRIQLVVFWALFTQKGHTTPKTFFANLKIREPLAPAVLDLKAEAPCKAMNEILLSIFCPNADSNALRKTHDTGPLPPFVSPYGASVLRCGIPGCGVKFYSDTDTATAKMHITVREGRARHLVEAYGADATFASPTGLPESTQTPKSPSSYHNTLHISTARTWAKLIRSGRQAIADAIDKGNNSIEVAKFIEDVRHEVCVKSRRGNIYSATIETEVRQLLPSLLTALRTASDRLGLDDRSGVAFEHDWAQNTIKSKMEYELGLVGPDV